MIYYVIINLCIKEIPLLPPSDMHWIYPDFNQLFVFSAAYDLPQRPNEAHIFYSNMSKTLVSLLGRTKDPEFDQNNQSKLPLPTGQSSGRERYRRKPNIQSQIFILN